MAAGPESEYSQAFTSSAVIDYSTSHSINFNSALSGQLGDKWTSAKGDVDLFSIGMGARFQEAELFLSVPSIRP